jgi:hypothetical protein
MWDAGWAGHGFDPRRPHYTYFAIPVSFQVGWWDQAVSFVGPACQVGGRTRLSGPTEGPVCQVRLWDRPVGSARGTGLSGPWDMMKNLSRKKSHLHP